MRFEVKVEVEITHTLVFEVEEGRAKDAKEAALKLAQCVVAEETDPGDRVRLFAGIPKAL